MKTKKILALALAAVLLVAVSVGGTLAWLTATSQEVKNTFTTSEVGVSMEETKAEYQMVPGNTITKDPVVIVAEGSEECWVFVTVTESENFDTYLSYNMASNWKAVPGVENVYYYDGEYENGEDIQVLENDAVVVSTEITSAEMAALETNQPTLTFKAYVCQKANVADAATAWSYINNNGKTPASGN